MAPVMQHSESLAIESWPIERVLPYPANPRTIPETAVAKVARSIQAYGWRQAIVVDIDGVVIAGHTRLLAAKRLKLAAVPVHIAADLSEAQAKAYRLADNRTGEETRWNPAELMTELVALGEAGMDLLAAGFDPTELPDFEPAFAPAPEDEVKRLDHTASEIACPHCGEHFQP